MYHKLPFYKCAAHLLEQAKESGVNIKHILFNEKKYKFMNIKSLFAIVSEALKHWNILEILINESKILDNEPGFNIWHVRILVTELIFGKKVIDAENDFGHKILQYESKFRELLSRQVIQELLPCKNNLEIKVRYIKVNVIKETVDSVINIFTDEGWKQITTAESYEEYLLQLKGLEPNSEFFLQDFHIPEVLVFPPGTELHSHNLYKNGSFFFMDKSSCLAPYLLRPHQDSCVLDMCAAPGLKAIHLAGLVQSGKVYAVERDAGRFQSLKDMVGLCGANCVIPIHKDVTKLQVDQYDDVEYILLDPSCTGSGMRGRQPLVKQDAGSNDKERLYRLAGFQLTLLRFALTRFPAAKRIVYSTCSLNVEENEEVIEAALNSKYHDFKVVSAGKKLPGWINFASQKYSFGSKCIYSTPELDLTNGFFVAVFQRRKHHIPKDLSESVVSRPTTDGFHCNGKVSNEDSKSVERANEIKENEFLQSSNVSRSGNGENKYSNAKKHKNSSTLHFPDKETPTKKISVKKRGHYNDIDRDTTNMYSPVKKMKTANENAIYNQNIISNERQKSYISVETEKGTKNEKSNCTKLLTSSQMKRLRQQNRKSIILKTSNITKQKKKQVKNQNVLKSDSSKINVKNDQIKKKKKQNKIGNSNEATLKMSKAKLRRKRIKKLKLNTNQDKDRKAELSSQSLNKAKRNKKIKYSTTDKINLPASTTFKGSLKLDDGPIKQYAPHTSENIKLPSSEIENEHKQLITSANDTEALFKSVKYKNKLTKEESTHFKEKEESEVLIKKKKKKRVTEGVSSSECITSTSSLHKKKHKKNLYKDSCGTVSHEQSKL